MGYKFQFVTLAGFHALNAGMFELARGYRERAHDGVRAAAGARVRARGAGYTATRHQREVGAGYFDQVAEGVVARRVVDPRPAGLDGGRAISVQAAVTFQKSRDRSPVSDGAPAWVERATPEALEFVAGLELAVEPLCDGLLRRGSARLNAGEIPDVVAWTRAIRDTLWRVAPTPPDLRDRRREITGPVDRKMMINALNSGARVFMADFEDACSPTWENVVQGHANLRDAMRREIEFRTPEKELPAQRADRDPDGPPARLAPGGTALRGRRRAGVGVTLRLRRRLLPRGALLLSAEARRTSRRGCGPRRSRSPATRRSAAPS